MLKSKNVFIIAEAGVNHNGKLSLAKELARKAKKAGADAVKFQTWITEDIIIPKTKKPIYQMNENKENNDQFNFAKKLELSFEEFVELKKFCKKTKIKFKIFLK
jgi:sialic acid synthase SpsE